MHRHEIGFSLVELMISMLLASLLSAALIQLFITFQQVYQLNVASSSLSERIGFASSFLSRHLMESGMSPLEKAAPFPIGIAGAQASTDGVLSDTLVILSEGGQGCIDSELEDNTGIEWRKFYINFQDKKNELRCEDSEGGPYPVLDKIDAFQVQFGIDSNADAAPDYYTNSSGLAINLPVVSVRYALLLRGDEMIGKDPIVNFSDWPLLDVMLATGTGKGNIPFDDGNLRRMFVSTVALRNTQQ